MAAQLALPALLLAVFAALAGCGQTGPLVLPEKQPATQQANHDRSSAPGDENPSSQPEGQGEAKTKEALP